MYKSVLFKGHGELIFFYLLQLLDACVINCGKHFQLEIASRDFESEFKKLLQKAEPMLCNVRMQILKKINQ